MKTFVPKAPAKSERKWYIVDASDKVLGRLATEVAVILRGKNKPSFSPHLDTGDYVVIINADKIKLTGNKEAQKEYIHHTGYLGHIKRKTLTHVRENNPTRILKEAVSGMMPKNRLRRFILDKLYVYAGSEHPHSGQNPIPYNL